MNRPNQHRSSYMRKNTKHNERNKIYFCFIFVTFKQLTYISFLKYIKQARNTLTKVSLTDNNNNDNALLHHPFPLSSGRVVHHYYPPRCIHPIYPVSLSLQHVLPNQIRKLHLLSTYFSQFAPL